MKRLKPTLLTGIMMLIMCLLALNCFSVKKIGLDNWYNRETQAKTGKIFHYTWDDTQYSGFSQLGDIFKNKGAELTTIDVKADKNSLKGIDVYIIVDPDTTSENPRPNYILRDDIRAISKWVKDGGVLLILANDQPNCEFTHLNLLGKEFGIHFNPVTLNRVIDKQYDMAAETNLPSHPIFKEVNKIYMKEVCSLSLSGGAKPVLTDFNQVYIAETTFGKGFVLAVGDPWLYNEYIDHAILPVDFENLKAANNLAAYLLSKVNK
jgi:unsaturated rhamnogalacturonyl hydrolase